MENINVKKGTRKSFVLYTSYADQIKLLNESEKAMLLDAIFEYQLTGELSVELCPMVAMAFSFMKRQFDEDDEKYAEKCARLSENAKCKGRGKNKDISVENFFSDARPWGIIALLKPNFLASFNRNVG